MSCPASGAVCFLSRITSRRKGLVTTRAANLNLNSKLKILWDWNLNLNSKIFNFDFHLYNIITTKFKKKKIFLLEIKDLMQKVGLSQAFSKIVYAKLKSSILYAERIFSVKHGLTNCLGQPFISHHCRWL